jgi:hypothetical protein
MRHIGAPLRLEVYGTGGQRGTGAWMCVVHGSS